MWKQDIVDPHLASYVMNVKQKKPEEIAENKEEEILLLVQEKDGSVVGNVSTVFL